MPDRDSVEVRVRHLGPSKPKRHMTVVGATLTDAKFAPTASWVNLENVRFERVDLSGLRFDPLHIRGSRLVGCDFSKSRFVSGSLGIVDQTVFEDCSFDRADLRGATLLGNARFVRCTFRGARIRGWRADYAEFVDCVFAGRLEDCVFCGRPNSMAWKVDRDQNEFSGNDFSAADLVHVSFEWGIDVHVQRWPASSEYVLVDQAQDRIRSVRAVVARWPEDGRRELALRLLRIYSEFGRAEQSALFVRRRDLSSIPADLQDEVWRLIESVQP